MEYNICLHCNQIITNNDLLNHLQENQDHINYCYKMEDLKILLSNANGASTLNNIFKTRIETIWSELKRLSNFHSQLTENLNNVSNHFKLIHDYLMSQEHSVKKPIQDDINVINDNITNQIKELTSIFKIINLNNRINNTNNISLEDSNHISEVIYLDESRCITDKYSISTFIELIQQSDTIYNFIENKNNTLFEDNNNNNIQDYKYNNLSFLNYIEHFNRQFNSCLTDPTQIKSQSIKIIKNHYTIKLNSLSDIHENLIKNSINVYKSPSAFVHIGDFEGLKEYYKKSNIIKLENKSMETIETIIEILKSNRIDILKYLIQVLQFDINTEFHLNLFILNYLRKTNLVDLLSMAAIYSNLQTIQYIDSLVNKKKVMWNYHICLELSTYSKNIEMLKYFSSIVIEKGLNSLDITFVSAYAAYGGNLDMIEWISQSTPFLFIYQISDHIENSIDFASMSGHLDIVKWLHSNRTECCTTKTMDNAAQNGHLETIKWLHQNRTEGCTTNAMDYAAQNGHLEIIKWLHENRTEGCTTNAMDNAALRGHFEIIKWLHHNRTEGCTTKAMDNAATHGHFEIIKWLHHNRTEGCGTELINYLLSKRNNEIINWLFDNRTECCITKVMNKLASIGHLEIIKWLHHNRTDGFSTHIMDIAAFYGHLGVIKWLHSNRTEGCTTNAMDYAAENGHLETIEWLHSNRTEGCTTNAINYAAKYGHLKTIEWLHSNRTEGCTTNAMDYAAENGHLETIKWLHENRTEGCTTWAMDNAARSGHFEIIKWLDDNRTEGCTIKALDFAFEKGHSEIIKYLDEIKTSRENKGKYNGFFKVIEWFKN